ncbi:MAG TPA: FAD-dependent oxidoreductase [Fibrobacteria bacterium]|nr:FAD-dependent oxidoreductase [Fibrobacteria bacterium]
MQDSQATTRSGDPGVPGRAYLLRELAVPASDPDPDLAAAIAGFLRVKRGKISAVKVLRKSLDSRKRNQPLWRYTLEFTFAGELRHPKVSPAGTGPAGSASGAPAPGAAKYRPPGSRVAVIGSGPAGMAAALGLARKGYRVTVFEQGSEVGKRFHDIRKFLKGNVFNPHSNILFGEGGAGTFSDGKLTCRTRTRFTETFLKELVACGADEDIVYLSHPHIGTDKLQFIVKAWRERCKELGCEFRFDTPVESLLASEGRISGVTVGGIPEPFDALVLAAGHSSRPLYRRLAELGVAMDLKPFSVGVRVEHPQEMVNRRQLGDRVDPSLTGAAEYYLTYNGETEGHSAYSFCMCPGGVVVPCADAEDGLFTNGMSYSNRAGAFANSAVVVPVTPADLDAWTEPDVAGSASAGSAPAPDTAAPGRVLSGLDFIRDLEIKAYALGGGEFVFPAQTIQAYLDDRVDALPAPRTSFPKPVKWVNLRPLFPPKIARALQESFRNFDRKLPGFIEHGLIIGPESRTSSPVRILRHAASLESVSTPGLFPLGEGAGYSGGIVSSGADGFRLAEGWEAWETQGEGDGGREGKRQSSKFKVQN